MRSFDFELSLLKKEIQTSIKDPMENMKIDLYKQISEIKKQIGKEEAKSPLKLTDNLIAKPKQEFLDSILPPPKPNITTSDPNFMSNLELATVRLLETKRPFYASSLGCSSLSASSFFSPDYDVSHGLLNYAGPGK